MTKNKNNELDTKRIVNGKIVCGRYDKDLCMEDCNGNIGYGCKQFPKDFYKGISGYNW